MKEEKVIGILTPNNFFDSVINKLPTKFKIFYPDDLVKNSELIRGIITTPWSKIDAKLIQALPNLEIISCFGTGIDSVDKITALNRGIILTNTPDLVTEDTADIAIILLLCLSRNIIFNDKFVRAGNWKKSSPPLGTSISGKTLGIVGLGKVGKKIAERAAIFGMNIIYHSRTKKDVSYRYFSDLIKLAENSDYLIVCCPGGIETANIINLNVLESLGKNGFLINVSRGSTVNEEELIYCLENKIISGAGLDVYPNEPYVNERLIKMDQVVLLPHIGTATIETRSKMLNLVIDNIQAYFNSGKPLTPIN